MIVSCERLIFSPTLKQYFLQERTRRPMRSWPWRRSAWSPRTRACPAPPSGRSHSWRSCSTLTSCVCRWPSLNTWHDNSFRSQFIYFYYYCTVFAGRFDARSQALLDIRIPDHGPQEIHGHKHPQRWADGPQIDKILPIPGDAETIIGSVILFVWSSNLIFMMYDGGVVFGSYSSDSILLSYIWLFKF